MGLTQEESVIIGSIIALTVVIVFGLILWYCTTKHKLKEKYSQIEQSPIPSDEQHLPDTPQIIEIQLRTTLRDTKGLSIAESEQNLLSNDTGNNTEEYVSHEQTTISAIKSVPKNSAANHDFVSQKQTNTNELITTQKVDNTGIVLVDTMYRMEVAQSESSNDSKTDEISAEIVPETVENCDENTENDMVENDTKSADINDNLTVENVSQNDGIITENNEINSNIVPDIVISDAKEENEITMVQNTEIKQSQSDEQTLESIEENDGLDKVNVKQQKLNILLGGVQSRPTQAIDRHKSVEQLKHAKVVRLQRNKFENSIKSNEKTKMEKKSGKSVVVKDVPKSGEINQNKSDSEFDYDIDDDGDDIGQMESHNKSKQNMSMVSTTASTQSVLNMDSNANVFGDRWKNGGYEFDDQNDTIRSDEVPIQNNTD